MVSLKHCFAWAFCCFEEDHIKNLQNTECQSTKTKDKSTQTSPQQVTRQIVARPVEKQRLESKPVKPKHTEKTSLDDFELV